MCRSERERKKEREKKSVLGKYSYIRFKIRKKITFISLKESREKEWGEGEGKKRE